MSETDAHRRVPLEIINQGRLELVDELFAPDYTEHTARPGLPPGREGIRAFFTAFRAAFPDAKFVILQEMTEGDKHVAYVQASGTMKGDFMGMPATNKSATWTEMHMVRVRDGKITDHWGVVDQLGMLQQLGVIPAPPGS